MKKLVSGQKHEARWRNVLGKGRSFSPEDVSDAEEADGRQTPGASGVTVVGGPHLDDDEGKNGGVLKGNTEQHTSLTCKP